MGTEKEKQAEEEVKMDTDPEQQQHEKELNNGGGGGGQDEEQQLGIGGRTAMGGWWWGRGETGAVAPLDLMPHDPEGWGRSRVFLEALVRILLDYIRQQNDRSTKGSLIHWFGWGDRSLLLLTST